MGKLKTRQSQWANTLVMPQNFNLEWLTTNFQITPCRCNTTPPYPSSNGHAMQIKPWPKLQTPPHWHLHPPTTCSRKPRAQAKHARKAHGPPKVGKHLGWHMQEGWGRCWVLCQAIQILELLDLPIIHVEHLAWPLYQAQTDHHSPAYTPCMHELQCALLCSISLKLWMLNTLTLSKYQTKQMALHKDSNIKDGTLISRA